jgi:hypothetical protein
MINNIIQWIISELQNNQFFGAAFFATVTTLIFSSLKEFPRILNDKINHLILYQATVYYTDDMYFFINTYIKNKYKNKINDLEYKANGSYDIDKIPVGGYFFIFKYFRIIKISFRTEKLENSKDIYNVHLKSFKITGLFAKKQIIKLIDEIVEYNKKLKIKPQIYTNFNDNYFSFLSDLHGKPLSDIILNETLKYEIINDIKNFKASKEEYKRLGINYKRGHCYYGPPGTGKTSLVKAIAIENNWNIYCINLNIIQNDNQLISLLSMVKKDSILLFEDIDSYFNLRKNLDKTSKLTFSGLINSLDGVIDLDNIFIIMTTNDIDKLDPALIRPGRIDLVKKIDLAKNNEINEYLTMFYKKQLNINKEVELPISVCQNICLSNQNDYKQAIKLIENYKKL